MSEVVSVHLQHAGIGIRNTWWELYCLERGIQLDEISGETIERGNSFGRFFNEIGSSEYVPRGIMCDLEPTAMCIEKLQREQFTASYLTRVCFESVNRIVNYNPRLGKFRLLFNGNDILNRHPIEFQWKFLYQSPTFVLRDDLAKIQRVMLSKAIAIDRAWTRFDHKFDLLYDKSHFLHWYVRKGIEICDFSETGESSLEKKFKEVDIDSVDRECKEQ